MYLFKRASDGVTIFGENEKCIYPGQLWVKPTSGNKVEFRNTNGEIFMNEIDITTVMKENGDYYTDIADFNAVSGTFFFSISGGPSVIIGNFRMISTETGLRIDKKLTALGFAGVETTDWETVGNFN